MANELVASGLKNGRVIFSIHTERTAMGVISPNTRRKCRPSSLKLLTCEDCEGLHRSTYPCSLVQRVVKSISLK